MTGPLLQMFMISGQTAYGLEARESGGAIADAGTQNANALHNIK